MKHRLRPLVLLPLLFSVSLCYPNDGAFKAQGNQLIPMYETDISVKKEILTIKRITENQVAITVYYEFYNPKKSKELEVGFEAISPGGDVDARPVRGQHPYIRGFTVNINGQAIPFSVSIVKDSLYFKNGKFKSITLAQAQEESNNDPNYVDFFYVYHFRAQFKEGLNTIIHTYTADLSGSVAESYSFDYILSAAGRWANRQIDDFTLQIDMGQFQDFSIPNSFFSRDSE